MESGGCCAVAEGNPGPGITYVEEAEDALRHIQKLGIASLATQWLSDNARSKILTPEEAFSTKANRKKENLLGFVRSLESTPKSQGKLNFLCYVTFSRRERKY